MGVRKAPWLAAKLDFCWAVRSGNKWAETLAFPWVDLMVVYSAGCLALMKVASMDQKSVAWSDKRLAASMGSDLGPKTVEKSVYRMVVQSDEWLAACSESLSAAWKACLMAGQLDTPLVGQMVRSLVWRTVSMRAGTMACNSDTNSATRTVVS
jgi:hypothetical protein